MHLFKSIAIVLWLFTTGNVCAQNKKSSGKQPFVLGVTEKIMSKQLSETRVLNIYLPEGYNKDTAHYPVIYLLDGSANEDFIHIVGIVQFLNMIQAMPNTIVVGIANVDRKRDFTFPTTIDSLRKLYPTTGHSDRFIAFIETELQPYIREHYRCNNSSTLIGQSLGGLLACEILVKKPQLFNKYLIVSPSLWWDNESLIKIAARPIASLRDMSVFLSVGTEGDLMETDARHWGSMLQGNSRIKWYFQPMPEENHLTILHNSAYKGLMLLNKK